MAKSKHNTTGRGTHRQRIFLFRQSILAARKEAERLEQLDKDAKVAALAAAKEAVNV